MKTIYVDEKERLLEDLNWVVRGRWVILAGLLFLGYLVKLSGVINPHLSILTMALLATAVALYNTLYWVYLKLIADHTLQALRFIAVLQTVVDQVIVVLIIHFTGGIESPDYSYFALTIIIASILYTPRGVMLSVATAIFLYIGLMVLEYNNTLPHLNRYTQPLGIQGNPLILVSASVVASVNIFLWGFLAAYLAKLRQLREDQLRLEHNRIASIIDSLIVGVLFIDSSHKLRLMNPAAENMFDLRFSQARLYVPFKHKPHKQRLKNLALVLEKHSERKTIKFESPKELYLKLNQVPLKDRNGKILGTIIILEDITREHAINKLKSEFISIAAHQLRTPLSAIKWIIYMLLQKELGPLTKQQRDFLEKGYGANERIIRLVDDLLNVSRIEEGRFGFKFRNIALDKLLKNLISTYKIRAKNKQINLLLKSPSRKLPLARIDPEKILLALDNLIDNAIKYTLPGGKIIVSIEAVGDKLKVAVKDEGVGIPEKATSQLFTKFFRADNVKKMQTEGSGLGLFIVKNIVEAHNGRMWYEPNRPRGSCFFFTVKQAPIGAVQDKFDKFGHLFAQKLS